MLCFALEEHPTLCEGRLPVTLKLCTPDGKRIVSTTEKLFFGEELSRKKSNKLGILNPVKAFERLAILNEADEKSLQLIPALHYHKLKGTSSASFIQI